MIYGLLDLIGIVHQQALWMDEKSYETKCEYYKGSYYIYNHYLWETEDIIHDCIIVICNKQKTYGRLYSVQCFSEINELHIDLYPELFDIEYYKKYKIDLGR